MRPRLLKWYDALRTSFWLVPAAMMLAAAVLSRLAMAFEDAEWIDALARAQLIYPGDPAGARAVLSTIAASMITIAGVVFSITIVVLSLASQQFGPRMIRNFMHDRGNQMVLGTFTGTFLYCILALGVVEIDDTSVFVPRLSVTLGVILAVISLAVLIYFIHHVASSIRVTQVIAAVGDELDEAIDRMFPSRIGEPSALETAEDIDPASIDFGSDLIPIPAPCDGYVQVVDGEALIEFGQRFDVIVRIERRPGDFAIEGEALAVIRGDGTFSDEALAGAARAFVLGSIRTPLQDLLFPIDQLAEIAVRALSPGVNDPQTALACIHRITASLSRLLERRTPEACRLDEQSKVPGGRRTSFFRASGPRRVCRHCEPWTGRCNGASWTASGCQAIVREDQEFRSTTRFEQPATHGRTSHRRGAYR